MPATPSPTTGQLPNGLDRADGLSGRIGTATPAGSLQVQSSAGANLIPIEEFPDSPEIERAEQATIVHRFRMSWVEAQNQILFYGRGTFLSDSAGNISRVLSAKIQHDKGETATLILTCESISFDTPPDEFSITEVELGVNIIKYPRYFYAFNPTPALDSSWAVNQLLNQDVIRALQNYFEVATSAYRDALTWQLQQSLGHPGTIGPNNSIVPDASFTVPIPNSSGSGNTTYTVYPIAGTDLAKRAALEIIQKYWHNEETPYVIGYEIQWAVYYFLPQFLNPGGYVEDPFYEATPQLPLYFWSPDWTGLTTVVDDLAEINPQCYSSTGTPFGDVIISWLRKADRCEYQRTWFKMIRRWIGSPIGFWDADLYNMNNAPWASGSNTSYEAISTPYINTATMAAAGLPNVQPPSS